MNKQDRTVIITGGASGIGKSLAFRFGSQGANIVVGDIEHVALNNTVSELVSEGISAIGIPVDVSDIDSVRSFRDEVISEFTPPYIAVSYTHLTLPTIYSV